MSNKITTSKKYSIRKSHKLSKKNKNIKNNTSNSDSDSDSDTVFTYAIGSSIIKLNKNTVNIYTDTNYSYTKLYEIDFINNFDINKIHNSKWTTINYKYSGNVFMSSISKNNGHKYPDFIHNKHLTYMLIQLDNNNYLSISSYVIQEFKLPDNDKIISVSDENYSRSHNQYIILNGNKYIYYISIPFSETEVDGKSFYMSRTSFQKYNHIYNLYDAGFNNKSKKWYIMDYVKIPYKILGITFNKSEPIQVYDIINELNSKYIIVNHNTDYN